MSRNGATRFRSPSIRKQAMGGGLSLRVTVLGMRSETLRANFQPPLGLRERHQLALHAHRDPKSTAIAMTLLRPRQPTFTAVWDSANGKLVWQPTEQRVGDIAWSPDGTQLFVAIATFGKGPKGRGI